LKNKAFRGFSLADYRNKNLIFSVKQGVQFINGLRLPFVCNMVVNLHDQTTFPAK